MDYTRRRYQNESEGKCMDMLQLMKEKNREKKSDFRERGVI